MDGSAQALAQQGRWLDVRQLLQSADPDDLGPDAHERHAIALGLTLRDQRTGQAWERAHNAWLEQGDTRRAARAAHQMTTRRQRPRRGGVDPLPVGQEDWNGLAWSALPDGGPPCRAGQEVRRGGGLPASGGETRAG